jgi:hypothetical protein
MKRLRARLRLMEIYALRALRQPHRYEFQPVAPFYAERVMLTGERIVHRVKCARGDHYVKFGTWPKCVYCGKSVQA